MKRESKNSGSFVACGTGFKYYYDSDLKRLEVSHAKKCCPVLFLDLDKELSGDPALFVSTLDKTCQIRALTLTNNASLDLSDVFDDGKLTTMLYETSRLARCGFDLMHENFARFERYFSQDSKICDVRLGRVKTFEAGSSAYVARMETAHKNQVSVESHNLHDLMSKFSQKIIQDLITREFLARFDSLAHTLLKTSSSISMLSLILNNKFLPSGKLRQAREVDLEKFTAK